MIGKLVKYSIVGIFGTVLHIGVLVFFVEVLKRDPLLSSAVGFLVTSIVSYLLNYLWTFRSNQYHKHAFPRYLLVCLTGLSLNSAILFITVNILGWWYMIGQAIAVILVPLSNFLLNYSWSFKVNAARSSE